MHRSASASFSLWQPSEPVEASFQTPVVGRKRHKAPRQSRRVSNSLRALSRAALLVLSSTVLQNFPCGASSSSCRCCANLRTQIRLAFSAFAICLRDGTEYRPAGLDTKSETTAFRSLDYLVP